MLLALVRPRWYSSQKVWRLPTSVMGLPGTIMPFTSAIPCGSPSLKTRSAVSVVNRSDTLRGLM